jgi:hypothetical protein
MGSAVAMLVAAGALVAPVFAQTNISQFKDAPASKFTPQDFDLMWASVHEVSATGKAGALRTWENTATGSGGTIKLLKVFTSADGRDCRRLRVENRHKSLKGSSKQTVCANPEGKWLIDADAKPAPG